VAQVQLGTGAAPGGEQASQGGAPQGMDFSSSWASGHRVHPEC